MRQHLLTGGTYNKRNYLLTNKNRNEKNNKIAKSWSRSDLFQIIIWQPSTNKKKHKKKWSQKKIIFLNIKKGNPTIQATRNHHNEISHFHAEMT